MKFQRHTLYRAGNERGFDTVISNYRDLKRLFVGMRGQVNSRKIGCLQRCRDRTTGENVWFKCSIVQETFDESRCTDVLPRVTPKPGLVLLHQPSNFYRIVLRGLVVINR